MKKNVIYIDAPCARAPLLVRVYMANGCIAEFLSASMRSATGKIRYYVAQGWYENITRIEYEFWKVYRWD